MQGDFTRVTFVPERHYSSVRMQQGRVQLDADWNEQQDITAHRVQTEARDVVGRCGAPWHDAGLAIAATAGDLPAGQQAAAGQLNFRPGDLFISAGRYYVAGILCENEQPVLASRQPDLPPDALIVRVNNNLLPLVPPTPAGVYLIYVDVWTRHLTAIEAPHILETALGGPDTCTRTKTIWQVRLLRVGNVGAAIDCASNLQVWNDLVAPPSGQLSARAEPTTVSDEPCIVAPGAGYRRLENQLYRVEVHKGGTPGNATFKWSRDNASIVTRWEQKNGDDLTVASIGRDKPLGFAAGQWIELTDDSRDQLGQSGTLVQLVKAEGTVLTIDPATATGTVDLASFSTGPKVRRWDSPGQITLEIPAAGAGFLPLESGVDVKFTAGTFRTGDYWLIPARTATGDVEWPTDAAHAPLPQPPRGNRHHFCRLAIAQFDAGQWTILSDCRELFPPATELINLDYAGGDGQEVRPDPTQPNALLELPRPLEVGVSRGKWPVAGARVQFAVTQGNGTVPGNGIVATAGDGVAACPWQLDSTTLVQQVEATLLDAGGQMVHLPVRFTARLSVAGQVAYDPKNCPPLAGITNVEDAIDALCKASHGGCCVTVGKEGQFKTLEEAIKTLLQKDVRDICLCLLPGDHESEGLDLDISANQPPLHLRIAGCGGGTRLILKGRIQLGGLASFSLSELTVNVRELEQPILLVRCSDVSIDHCQLVHTEAIPNDALLAAVDAQRLHLHDSTVEQHLRSSRDRLRSLFAHEPRLDAVFEAAGRGELTIRATALSATLADEDLHGREHMAEDLEQSIARAGRELGPRVSEMARELAAALRTDGVAPRVLTSRLTRVFEAAAIASPGTAIVLVGTGGDASLCNNQIMGAVSLQGLPAAGDWTPDELKVVGQMMLRGLIGIGSSDGTLRLHANRLTRLAVDETMLKQVKDLVAAGGGRIEGAIQSMIVGENIFLAGRNQLVSPDVSFGANAFERVQEDAGTVISRAATFVGNRAGNDIRLFNVSVANQKAANLIINVVDL